MSSLLLVSRLIDKINGALGQIAAWAILAAVVISAGNALLRHFFGTSSNAWLEMQWYLFGAVVMLCAAWALREEAHVRIDVVAGHLSRRWRHWLDLFGLVAFLSPFAGLMMWLGGPYAFASLESREVSLNPGGLTIWPIKMIIFAGFISLFAQGLSEIIKRIAIMSGFMPDPEDAISVSEPDDTRSQIS
ncbi:MULTISPECIES: TRAP transporter small permease subunit [unclassified Chelatococcus]|uniref:TRAP transporter small permease subunit n=1 Tax=unclassified Chelatococcus TaxID=2638111 RepID=UPI001BCF9B98|nr:MULTISPECIES: TRAP transporter small permease subunit [unclassified Chelatococcus]MBS7700164.1 TRAP transporter small permease subunit [Chelatococcus sp. YT9]MBX3556857.1 TRAP transporter small permease subunit [Chelatococcus sp.]